MQPARRSMCLSVLQCGPSGPQLVVCVCVFVCKCMFVFGCEFVFNTGYLSIKLLCNTCCVLGQGGCLDFTHQIS
jgi:hypothetical protein